MNLMAEINENQSPSFLTKTRDAFSCRGVYLLLRQIRQEGLHLSFYQKSLGKITIACNLRNYIHSVIKWKEVNSMSSNRLFENELKVHCIITLRPRFVILHYLLMCTINLNILYVKGQSSLTYLQTFIKNITLISEIIKCHIMECKLISKVPEESCQEQLPY